MTNSRQFALAGKTSGKSGKAKKMILKDEKDKKGGAHHIKCNFPEWIGKPVDRHAVKQAAGDRRVRIYGVNDMVTMDYRPERLNVIVNNEGIVKEVKCG